MKNIVKQALCALMILAPMAPAYGMFAGLKRSLMAQKAAYSTLGARLLKSTPTFKVAVERPTTVQVQPATKRTLGFFASLIGYFWPSNEEKLAGKIAKNNTIKDALNNPNWNADDYPAVFMEVGAFGVRNKMTPTETGHLYNKVKDELEKIRLSQIGVLNTKNIHRQRTRAEAEKMSIQEQAKNLVELSMKAHYKDDKGVKTPMLKTTDEQRHIALTTLQQDHFLQCKHPETKKRICDPALDLAFKHMTALCRAIQNPTPSTPATPASK